MIIKNVCLLLEALSILICLHYLYGEKFKLDIVTVSYLSIHMIILTAINYFRLPKTYTIIMYPFFIIYCGMRFGFQIKKMIINMALCIVILGLLQISTGLILSYFLNTTKVGNLSVLITNCITVIIVSFLLPLCNMRSVSLFLKDKGKILMITMGICIIIVLRILIDYKKLGVLDAEPLIWLFISVIFMFILSGQLNKYKIKAKEVETELRMQKLYADSFKEMIDYMRLRQHEFNSHINMLHNMHLKYHTYEGLVEAQESYSDAVRKENPFYNLLKCGNSVIIGFLYGRFVEFDKVGIEISYQVSIQELEIGILIHKIVEILGDLMNNAVEALLADGERKRLHVSVIENDGLYIEVRNESAYIPYKEIEMFFAKDYSRKGENRGLGLYNVKQICEEYGLDISCDNVAIDGNNWITFAICKEKETT